MRPSAKTTSTKECAHGRWRQILPALGIDDRFLTGRNCPCPMCGGTDRFRFLDRKPGDGMWVCNQCQPQPRPAIELAIKFTGKPFRDAARAIDDIIGGNPMAYQAPIRIAETNGVRDDQFQKAWRRGRTIRRRDAVDIYLRQRGVGLDIYPPCLRFSPEDYCYEDDATFLAENCGEEAPASMTYRVPTMVAAITNPDGQHVAAHRTFLSTDGRKANVSKPRRVTGKLGKGPTIRLMPTAALMGIAEGIETAMSASRLFQVPVWSVVSAHGIQTFEPPPECRSLIVFADHDKHGVGLRAAEALRGRLSLPVEIRMPDHPGADWNDVLLETGQ